MKQLLVIILTILLTNCSSGPYLTGSSDFLNTEAKLHSSEWFAAKFEGVVLDSTDVVDSLNTTKKFFVPRNEKKGEVLFGFMEKEGKFLSGIFEYFVEDTRPFCENAEKRIELSNFTEEYLFHVCGINKKTFPLYEQLLGQINKHFCTVDYATMFGESAIIFNNEQFLSFDEWKKTGGHIIYAAYVYENEKHFFVLQYWSPADYSLK